MDGILTVKVGAEIPKSLHKRMEIIKCVTDKKFHEIIHEALDQYCDRTESELRRTREPGDPGSGLIIL